MRHLFGSEAEASIDKLAKHPVGVSCGETLAYMRKSSLFILAGRISAMPRSDKTFRTHRHHYIYLRLRSKERREAYYIDLIPDCVD